MVSSGFTKDQALSENYWDEMSKSGVRQENYMEYEESGTFDELPIDGEREDSRTQKAGSVPKGGLVSRSLPTILEES